MIKDKRKTKENSKNQEQYINWIKEYFAEAPITINSDKTKIYIRHKNYPVSLENTSIIEKFTNKNKGIDFTREQAIKEAERLRNELAIEVKNYKTEGISIIQNLIKQHLKETFGAENITDIKFIGDCVVSFKYKNYQTTPLNFENEVYYMLQSKNTSFEEFELSDLEDCIDSSEKYWKIATEIIENIAETIVERLQDTDYTIDYDLDMINVVDNGNKIIEEIWDSEGADMTTPEKIDYVIEEVESVVSHILSNLEEQKECVEYAEENYKQDIDQLITKLEADIKIKYPEFKIYSSSIHVDNFDNSGFSCLIEFDSYKIELDITDYHVFEQSGFRTGEDWEEFVDSEENYCYKIPYVNKFDYIEFLEIVEEKLNEIKEEILEDLSK